MRAHQLQGALTGLIMVLLYIIYVLVYSEFQLATVEPKVQTSHSLHKNIVFHQWLVRIIRLDDMTIVFVYKLVAWSRSYIVYTWGYTLQRT